VADFVEVDVHDGVATILLNRPKMNALNLQMQREIHAAAEEIAGRADIGAVVLHGGPKVFAAGADVKEMADMSFQEMSQAAISLQGSFTALAQIPQPTIAAITGYALGGGCELAMCCDMRIAADEAKLTTAFSKVGLSGDFGGSYFLTQILGAAKAREMYFTAEVILGKEAARIGLVNRSVPADQLAQAAADYARELASLPTIAVGYMKRNLNAAMQNSLSEVLDLEATHMIRTFETHDHKAAAVAFVEKRAPKFEGR